MIKERSIPDTGLEYLPTYANIERSAIMKVSTRSKLFSCAEVIGWILQKADITKMILSNVEGQVFSTYSPAYVAQACKLPTPQNYLTEEWLKGLHLDILDNVKRMMVPEKQFHTRPSREYETAHLRTPYRLIALMLNRIFWRANGKHYKLSWVPVIFFVATQGTIFNSANIISNSMSSCTSVALGGVSQKKSDFYMSSFLIDCILCT